MEAFLLSYPMVLTPKNDLALLWAEEYSTAPPRLLFFALLP
jgi:hypothetical protein